MKQLLEAGVHFGHQTRRWNPKMAQYIFTERNGIYIIDLQKTVKKLEEAYDFVRELSANGGTVLFVGTKKQAADTIKEEAERAGMYYVNVRWPGGMLTNLYNQLKAQGAEDRFDEVLAEMPNVRRDLGYPPLVTPTSQITGSAAALNVLYGRYKIVTNEVRDIVRGKYGRVPGKIDEKFRKMCIGDEPVITHRPADDLEPELEKSKKALADEGFPNASPEDVLSYTLFPEVALPFFRKRDNK